MSEESATSADLEPQMQHQEQSLQQEPVEYQQQVEEPAQQFQQEDSLQQPTQYQQEPALQQQEQPYQHQSGYDEGQGGNYQSSHVSSSPAPQDSANPSDEIENKIFIGGLSWQTTVDGLRFYFEKFGELSDVALMTDRHTGQPRGFGFITMVDSAGVFLTRFC